VAITEQSRHRMYKHLEEIMGVEDAGVLMEHLPPVGWADVATKRDLDMLRLEWRADLANGFRLQTFALLGGFAVINGIMLAVAKL
jgi:hypothetical protein